jgi:hypothetical protein
VFHPAAYRLVGNHDPAFSQQVLDIAEAEGEPGIESDGLLNDHGWEAISGIRRQAQQCDKANLKPTR